jgi:O-acetyl-ADP-ribose deacetylase (regulator of RNase III)
VNAANSYLLGGGGVDGAIHRAGGPAILAECRQIVSRIGTLPAGQAVITTGGRLAARHVIHTVGPVYRGGENREADTLTSCHRESVRLADQHGLTSLSFPAISTGAYGYPVTEAAADCDFRGDQGSGCRAARDLVPIRTLRPFHLARVPARRRKTSALEYFPIQD